MKLRSVLSVSLCLLFATTLCAQKAKSYGPRKIAAIETGAAFDKGSSFIVISKKHLCLSVYGKKGAETVLLARYPACLSRNKGNKQRRGDNKTPESPAGKPFKITQIQPSGTWRHNFGDGRGNILSYGAWFLRLQTPGHSGIGIHGSTNNRASVPGRDSEGCIRLYDEDIIALKEKFAYVGMPVTVTAENADWLPFEKKYANVAATAVESSEAEETLEIANPYERPADEITPVKPTTSTEEAKLPAEEFFE